MNVVINKLGGWGWEGVTLELMSVIYLNCTRLKVVSHFLPGSGDRRLQTLSGRHCKHSANSLLSPVPQVIFLSPGIHLIFFLLSEEQKT